MTPLILVFGLWLNPANVTYLDDFWGDCKINFAGRSNFEVIKYRSCNTVAEEIQRSKKNDR